MKERNKLLFWAAVVLTVIDVLLLVLVIAVDATYGRFTGYELFLLVLLALNVFLWRQVRKGRKK